MTDPTNIHAPVLTRFRTLIRKHRLAHAYLFVGPSYIGKGETSLALAKMINCERNVEREASCDDEGEFYCAQCPECLKITSGNHPDVRVIESGIGESIKIEQIREMLNQVKLRPFSGRQKVFILKNIENMTPEGANALLKTLEEPSASSLLLLTTSVPEKTLDTVKSRCQMIHFLPLSAERLAVQLTDGDGESSLRAHFLAYFAEGCPGKAQRFKEIQMFEKKNEVIDRFLLTTESQAYMKKILADKEQTREFLDVLLSWIRDCVLIKTGIDSARLIHRDRINELRRFQERFAFEELLEAHQDVVRMCQLFTDNLNIKIPLALIRTSLKA